MPEQAEDLIVRNLVEALNRLRDDLDRVEFWTAALSSFQQPAPDYRPDSEYLLSSRKRPAASDLQTRSCRVFPCGPLTTQKWLPEQLGI